MQRMVPEAGRSIMGPRRRMKDAAMEEQNVSTVRLVKLDAVERVTLVGERILLLDRGALPMMRLLGQLLDEANVLSLEVYVEDRAVINIRTLTGAMERRINTLSG